AGGQPQARMAKVTVLRGPHLVLAHTGADDRFTLGMFVYFLDHVVRLDQGAGAVIVHRIHALQLTDMRVPRAVIAAEILATTVCGESLHRLRQQADVAPLHALYLIDFGAVDVEVRYAFGIPGELRWHTGYAVIKTRANG